MTGREDSSLVENRMEKNAGMYYLVFTRLMQRVISLLA